MKFAEYRIALCAVCAAAACAALAEAEPLNETEVWNSGVEAYRAGDVTNAVAILRPLMLSREYGARAAEVVAAVAYDRACTPGSSDALSQLEEAAAAAQLALRANPEDARARSNFNKAVDSLPELRETAHINQVLEAARNKDPGAMLKASRDSARKLLAESATYRTNAAPVAISLADSLSERAAKIADSWICVKELIAQSVTNEEQSATISHQVDEAKARTEKAAKELSDMDAEAYSSIALAEQDFTRFHKLVALPPDAIAEDYLAQSNAWQDVETVNSRSWQQEALDYTRGFRAKFPAWARAYEQQAQADTNKPPFTAEAQAEISGLATELEKLQLECIEKLLPPKQEEALGIIERIRELLPKDNSRGGGGTPQGSPQTQEQGDKNNDRQEGENKDENSPEETPDDLGRREDAPEQQEAEAQQAAAEEEEREDPGDKEVEALLKKAQERADEHEAEKRARMRKAPLPPNERDW